MSTHGREVRLAARPVGEPKPTDFELADVELPDLEPGQVLVRNLVMSVDPYMRGRMNDRKSYVAPFEVGKALEGGAVGEVVASEANSHRVGDVVLHGWGWRSHAVGDARHFRTVDVGAAGDVGPSAYLGVLGMPGMTAYVGLFDIAQFHKGDSVFVSGAAGAVGSLVGQLAKAHGAARVVGSAGSAEKVRWLRDELGFDTAFNYHDGPVMDQLAAAAPDGIDVYFDNVGGDHLEAAIAAFKPHGRAALCGAVSAYNAVEPPPGPHNLFQAVGKRLTLRGFIVGDHQDRHTDFLHEVGSALREGRLQARETVVAGLDNAPDAFMAMLHGENLGKMVVTLG